MRENNFICATFVRPTTIHLGYFMHIKWVDRTMGQIAHYKVFSNISLHKSRSTIRLEI